MGTDWITTHEAARIMKVSADTVRRELKAKRLVGVPPSNGAFCWAVWKYSVIDWTKSERARVVHQHFNSHVRNGTWNENDGRQEQYDAV